MNQDLKPRAVIRVEPKDLLQSALQSRCFTSRSLSMNQNVILSEESALSMRKQALRSFSIERF
jgi:hypothetical protein